MFNRLTPTFAYPARMALALLLLVTIAMFFWFQSRYPDLNDKALMGGAIELQDPLSFEARYQIDPVWPVWKKIFYTTINWMFTNRRGMMFGVLFGAAMLTALRYMPKRGFKNAFANSFAGLLIGAPLGVCVNCASPVAAGMYTGGSRAETTLAAMIASPTFNVIVLSMLISLFPVYMVVTKIGFTLALILIAIPLICRILPKEKLSLSGADVSACIISPTDLQNNKMESFTESVWGFARDFARDLWFIVKMTVPLMVLAGFLGSVIATLIPFEMLSDLPVNALTVVGVAVIGVIAPVPMGFDIILAAILLASGTSTTLIMVLLFTLGSYSIYSHIIIARTISSKLAFAMAGAIIAMGILAGVTANFYSNWQVQKAMEKLGISSLIEDMSLFSVTMAHAEQIGGIYISEAPEDISVSASPFVERSKDGETLFYRQEAWHRGIDRPNNFSINSMFTPFNLTPGSAAAGDLDQDGDMDVVMSNIDVKPSVMLFYNDGTGHFTKVDLDLAILEDKTVFGVVPVDVNNDSWPDLFVQTHLEGNYLLLNNQGKFSNENVTEVANREGALLTLTAGFGDLNHDGYLDVVLGNHEGARMGYFPTERDINRIIFNEAGKLDGSNFREIDDVPGDTLSIILTDFNQDGMLDYAEANDFNQPDLFFFGDGKGALKKITNADEIIPNTPHTTMSIKTADLNNDGDFEILMTQIAGRADSLQGRLRLQPMSEFCKGIEREDDRAKCQKNVDLISWYKPGGFRLNIDQVDKCDTLEEIDAINCKSLVFRDLAVAQNKPEMCEQIPEIFVRARLSCNTRFLMKKEYRSHRYENDILQVKGRNVLLEPNETGKYDDITKEAGLEIGGWSWDVKVFSFDNDENVDLFIMNGFWGLQSISQSKVYMENAGDLKFVDRTREVGAEDYGIIASAAAADYDNDGDIDLISATQNGPLVAFWNNSQEGNSVIVELRDDQGNSFGIGAKVRIFYGTDEAKMQIRELQMSSGFTAFDAPYVHFGLGEHEEIRRIEIDWATGADSVIEGTFMANRKLRISRAGK